MWQIELHILALSKTGWRGVLLRNNAAELFRKRFHFYNMELRIAHDLFEEQIIMGGTSILHWLV